MTKETVHLMIDMETLGTTPNAVVGSIGAVLFTKSGIKNKFYQEFFLESQIKKGRIFSEGTLRFWFNQPKESLKVFTEKSGKVEMDAHWLSNFIESIKQESDKLSGDKNSIINLRPWSFGATFDLVIFEDLLRCYGVHNPMEFRNYYCLRTFNNITKCLDLVKREGVHHNALDDSIYQASCVIAYMNRGKK